MNVLMVGVHHKRMGGMWTVAASYIENQKYNQNIKLTYIPTITSGTIVQRSLFMLNGYRKILWRFWTKEVDIVHVHMAEKGSTFRKGLIVKLWRKKNKKIIIHLHAGPFMAWYSVQNPRIQKYIQSILNDASKICVLGEYWKNQLSSIVNPQIISVLYNGIKCPEKNPYNENGKNIIYLGVMCKNKGIYDLINAIESIDTNIEPTIKVQLCGIDLEGDVADIIQMKNLNERIEMMGWIDEKTREKVFRNAILMVLPSYFEGLSMAVLEAMAHGVPVITTNISTMPELLGESISLVEPGNCDQLSRYIFDLIENKNERKRMSRIEFERVRNLFSEETFINKTLDIYNECFK